MISLFCCCKSNLQSAQQNSHSSDLCELCSLAFWIRVSEDAAIAAEHVTHMSASQAGISHSKRSTLACRHVQHEHWALAE